MEYLDRVLTVGIDVEPTDAPIYAADLFKAWEYGPLFLALDPAQMERSFKNVPAGTPRVEIDELKAAYPTEIDQPDGTVWLSRYPEHGAAHVAEQRYGWWIPGDPRSALKAVIRVGG